MVRIEQHNDGCFYKEKDGRVETLHIGEKTYKREGAKSASYKKPSTLRGRKPTTSVFHGKILCRSDPNRMR
jgi:hypothetical protein